MPCRTDHMEPTGVEIYLQRTAKLIVFVLDESGSNSNDAEFEWIVSESKYMYANEIGVMKSTPSVETAIGATIANGS